MALSIMPEPLHARNISAITCYIGHFLIFILSFILGSIPLYMIPLLDETVFLPR